MKISDLKFGDIATLRNGTTLYPNVYSWYDFNQLDNELKYKHNRELDIMKIQRYTPSIVYERFYYLDTIYERKEEILDDKEKEYLRGVIKPFRKWDIKIKKKKYENQTIDWAEQIVIRYGTQCTQEFLPFKKGTMYKGMKLYKEYTIEELEL